MNRDYAESKIREALKSSNGSQASARQQLIHWAAEDQRLLFELVAPHLPGVVAHAVSRVLTQDEKPAKPAAAAKKPPADAASAQPAKKGAKGGDPFGMEILKAIALGNPAQFGMESAAAPMKKQAASQQHVDAIRQMVSKGKTKK